MAEKINLRSSKVQERQRQVGTYGTQTPLSSTAVERGTTRWLSGSRVDIDGVLNVAGTANVSGLLDVTGTASVSGALNVSGTTTLSGSTTIAGPTGITGALTIAGSSDITGPLTVQGITTISGELNVTGPTALAGTLDITGATTLAANLDVTAGGKITAGQTVIEPTGKASFGTFIIDPASNKLIQAPGGWLFSDGIDQMALSSTSSSSVNLNSSYAELNYKGTSVVRAENGLINLNAPQTSVNGNLAVTGSIKAGTTTELSQTRLRVGTLPTASVQSGAVANVYVDANGNFYRVPA